MPPKPAEYVSNKQFFEALVNYKKECLDEMEKLSLKDADRAREYEYMVHCQKEADETRILLDIETDIFNKIVEKYSDELTKLEAYKIAHQANDAFDRMKKAAKIYRNHYVAFANSITVRPSTALYNYIGSCISQIATRSMNRPNFAGYSYKDEMAGDAILDCILRLNNFDETRSSNGFAFFSQICHNSAVHQIKKQHTERDIKISILKNLSVMEEFSENYDDDESSGVRESVMSMLECLEPVERKPLEAKYKKTNKTQQRKLREIDEKIQIAEKEINYPTNSAFDEFYEESEEVLDESSN
jgi:DNA-directed RNA polymerase specialized sigma24 family protein